MKLICFHFLCLVPLLLAWKGPADADDSQQSCEMSDQLEEECSVYAFQVTKPMLRYFEQVTQKIDEHSAEMNEIHIKHQRELETKNDRIHHLEEKEIELQRQINQLEEKLISLQIEKASYKSREDSIADVQMELKKQQIIIEQLSKNQCDMENKELKIKNDRIHDLEEREIDLQRENKQLVEKVTILSSSYKSREDSMADILKKTIIEQLSKNQGDMEKGELKTKNDRIHHLEKNEIELESENKQLVEKVRILQNENTTCKSKVLFPWHLN